MNSYSTFRRWNNITGWVIFVISSLVYILTLEPTVSFWDCGEFILSAFKLQIGHPPGAPLFLLLGRVASLLAMGNTSKVSVIINGMNALFSGLTIMFLFWTITHLIRRLYRSEAELSTRRIFAILCSGALGALAYTFSDTFWFSAVEGEVYALSSFITGFVFWAMLKWEDEADKAYSGRWIILIAYIMGLGIGVHRLCLLVIPALVFIYYFRNYEVSLKGVIKATVAAVSILWLMVFVIMPGIPKAAGWFELFFVNGMGLPFNSGLYFYLVLVIAVLVLGIWLSVKKEKALLNFVFTILAAVFIGYSSYAMIIIRSNARPPMNQNNPSDVFSFIYYINMEQYGSPPKIYGNYYSVPATGVKQVIEGYNKINGRYKPYYRPEYTYSSGLETLFPRMYSSDPDHESAYKYWGKVSGRKYSVETGNGKKSIVVPTFGENIRFFFNYQIGFMYWRYFMWNFAGRQNDIQGNGNPLYGNWISGIKFIDKMRLGDQDSLPRELLTNPGRNTYYFLPLILGLAGLFWHYRRDKNGFWLITILFIMTGLAIILFLNQTPNQPRERDYAYVGSFYAFAVWIGMGFMLVDEAVRKYFKGNFAATVAAFILLLFAVPVLMGAQNWDDHSRAGRYTCRDIGSNYLKSVDKNAIIFTYGDNDSFPLWYVQDVEGVRTDVRVANLSYIQAGWYIEMMRQKAYGSDPLPFTLGPDKYIEGKRTQMPVDDRVDKPVPISQVIDFAGLEERKAQVDVSGNGDYTNYIPVNKLQIDVDRSQVLANGTVKPYFGDSIISPMVWKYTDNEAFKGDLAMMDLLSTNKWKRPIYISTTVPGSQYKGLEKFFIQEGLAYRIAPVKTGTPEPGEFGMIDPQVMYDNMMNKFTWGNADAPGVYLDENNRRMFSNFRRLFGLLGKKLYETGDTARAYLAVKKGLSIVPPGKMPYDFFAINLAEVLYLTGHKDDGLVLLRDILKYSESYLLYISRIPPAERIGLDYPIGINMQSLIDMYRLANRLGLKDLSATLEGQLNKYYGMFYSVDK
ncbi:MAG TPA: DUF2723 domain-containing protein [Bacteroidales bacterium]|nr:DUF2723 domain-containing protein [Bacteroidales bacterium]